MNIYEARRALKFGWVAEATLENGTIIRIWGANNNTHHSTQTYPPHAEYGYGTGYGMGGITDNTVFVVRQETIEELHARYVRAGLGGE